MHSSLLLDDVSVEPGKRIEITVCATHLFTFDTHTLLAVATSTGRCILSCWFSFWILFGVRSFILRLKQVCSCMKVHSLVGVSNFCIVTLFELQFL
jgi:hypothetical protein